ncbi:hypothetical protein KIN20_017188 [Parelaphostrongylus tenuis]|uniref:Uncharacterized protein n=1 Tax=Parelaphostrongylus tenuis TaxID=148309 RepID=A0AAD5MMW4_PARTN|nr:hypothetical protein KIN20_017188 [Parelaphostrongylus tenuis]
MAASRPEQAGQAASASAAVPTCDCRANDQSDAACYQRRSPKEQELDVVQWVARTLPENAETKVQIPPALRTFVDHSNVGHVVMTTTSTYANLASAKKEKTTNRTE